MRRDDLIDTLLAIDEEASLFERRYREMVGAYERFRERWRRESDV